MEELNGVKRTVCEVWSRVVGYFRPVSKWNKGKSTEFKDRKEFKSDCGCDKKQF